jgi:hypothetical protein
MSPNLQKFSQSACALAVTLLLAACGGGTAEPPPETVPPTLAITDSEAGATATGPVTFTFTFSEDVGTSFTAEDVLVTGGTAGTLTKVSATVYTMVVTPTSGVSGTLSVSVAAGKYADIALNQNTASASASQAYGSGSTSTAFISWDEPEGSVPFTELGTYGDASLAVEAAPGGASGNALKITRSGAQNFGGTYAILDPKLPFTSTNKTITARVYASRAGAVINLKVEVAGGSSVELPATVTAANTWQTLTWNFSDVNTANNYTVIAISPDTDVTIGGAQTYWIDDITVTATSGGGGGGGGSGPSGNTGTCTAPCIDFASAGVGYEGFEGLVSVGQDNDPVDGTNKVAKFVKGPSGQPWAGATIFTASGDKSVTAFDFAASKVVTLRVYSPAAGLKMTLKVENAADPGTNALKTVTTTQANAWETLTFDFTTPTQGSVASGTFNKVSFFPLFDPTVVGPTAPASDTTVYIDELKYTGASGGGGGGGGSGAAIFSAGFSAGNLTASGGGFGGFSGSNQDSFFCAGDPAFCGSGGDFSGGAGSYYYYYYQTKPDPATALYMGIYVLAPGVTAFNDAGDTAGVALGSRTNLKFTLGQNPEWFNSATNNFMIVVDLGKRYVAGGGTCRLQLRNVTTPTAAAATAYTIPWTAFDLVQNCGQSLTVAQALAASPISQISFQGVGGSIALPAGGKTSGANLSNANGDGFYPTTLVLSGAITIE